MVVKMIPTSKQTTISNQGMIKKTKKKKHYFYKWKWHILFIENKNLLVLKKYQSLVGKLFGGCFETILLKI